MKLNVINQVGMGFYREPWLTHFDYRETWILTQNTIVSRDFGFWKRDWHISPNVKRDLEKILSWRRYHTPPPPARKYCIYYLLNCDTMTCLTKALALQMYIGSYEDRTQYI